MNPDDNKNENPVTGATPEVPDTVPPMATLPTETPEPTGTTGFDATGDELGDPSSSAPVVSDPEQPAQTDPVGMSDPSAGLPGSVMPPATTSSDPASTPMVENPVPSPSATPVTPEVVQSSLDPTSAAPAGGSKTLVVVLVVLIVLLAAAAAAYFAGLFG